MDKSIKYLIIDDDVVSAALLKKYLLPFNSLTCVGLFENTARAREYLKKYQADLLFLDIEMPDDDGISFLRQLELDLMVVFVTSKSKYALTAFDFDPIHFLTKPLDREKLAEAVRRVLSRSKTLLSRDEIPSFLVLKEKGAHFKISHSEIFLVEAAADYMIIHTRHKSHIFHITMKELAALLPEQHFKRVHRSYLVNKEFVSRVEKESLIVNGKDVPIGPKYKAVVNGMLDS